MPRYSGSSAPNSSAGRTGLADIRRSTPRSRYVASSEGRPLRPSIISARTARIGAYSWTVLRPCASGEALRRAGTEPSTPNRATGKSRVKKAVIGSRRNSRVSATARRRTAWAVRFTVAVPSGAVVAAREPGPFGSGTARAGSGRFGSGTAQESCRVSAR